MTITTNSSRKHCSCTAAGLSRRRARGDFALIIVACIQFPWQYRYRAVTAVDVAIYNNNNIHCGTSDTAVSQKVTRVYIFTCDKYNRITRDIMQYNYNIIVVISACILRYN